MPVYTYKGKNGNGEYVGGSLAGDNSDAVATHLLNLGIYPISIKEEISKNKVGKKNTKIDLLLFTRQMYVLLKLRNPLAKALKTLENSNQDETLKEIYGDIQKSLDNGYEFNVALQKQKQHFSQFYISMVKVGEVTGRLEEVFSKLYEYIDFESEMKNKAKAAIRYPMIVIGVMAMAFAILSFFVIPAFAKVYENFNALLLFPTRILIGFSDFMLSYGLVLMFLFGGFFCWFLKYIKTTQGRFWGDKN